LKCVADGSMGISITWHKNGIALSALAHIIQWETQKNGLTFESTLQFQSLTRQDEGSYVCTATNQMGVMVSSNAATVIILGPPVITEGPQDITTNLHNSSFRLPCTAHGPPDISNITWNYALFANNGLLVHRGEITGSPSNPYLLELPSVDMVITDNVTQYDISCSATNDLGTVTSNIATIYLRRVPTSPVISHVIPGKNMAEIWWLVDFSDVQVCVVKVLEDGGVLVASNQVSAPTNAIIVRNLNPSEQYTALVKCHNYIGFSKWSEPYSFTPVTSLVSPQNVSLTFSPNQTTVSWRKTLHIVKGNLTGYRLEVYDVRNSNKKSYEFSSQTLSAILTGLTTHMEYGVRVCGLSGSQKGPFSRLLTFHGVELRVAAALKYPLTYNGAFVVITIVIVILILTIVAAFCYCFKRKSAKQRENMVSYDQVSGGGTLKTLNDYYTPMSNNGSMSVTAQLEDMVRDVLIENNRVELDVVLGEGEFGFVYKAQLSAGDKDAYAGEVHGNVAVKSIKMNGYAFSEVESFIKEGLRMKDLDHPNVMRLIGISFTEEDEDRHNLVTPLVLLPYMPNGDLRSYLFTLRTSGLSKKMTVHKLLLFALDVAKGMQYLAERSFIHRDLAARNCMLDGDYNVVVSDFGLSRKVYSESYYRQTHISKMPVKWMAIESLVDNVFTTKSDVWAFGVTVWEILSMSQTPYPGVANHEVHQLLRNGTRLSKPPHCPAKIWYRAVFPCWTVQVHERPSFDDIVETLEDI
uniref:receptor protein-tyrosine kinase n=1 Tax=Ciona savignyi TaxID=51511 RepID=H2Z416_CIOSA